MLKRNQSKEPFRILTGQRQSRHQVLEQYH